MDKQSLETRGRVAATQRNLFMKDDYAQRGEDTPKNLCQSVFFLKTALTNWASSCLWVWTRRSTQLSIIIQEPRVAAANKQGSRTLVF